MFAGITQQIVDVEKKKKASGQPAAGGLKVKPGGDKKAKKCC